MDRLPVPSLFLPTHRRTNYPWTANSLQVGDGGRRDNVILHKLCVLDGLLDVLVKGVKLVKILLNLVSSYGWLGLSAQPTPKEVDRWKLEKVKALGANGDVSGSRVGVVWMEVGGGIVRARVVSRVVVGLVMKVVLVVLRGFWVEELALEAMEYDDQDEEDYLQIFRKCHIDTLGHTYHSVGDVVGKVEVFSNGEAVEHVAQARFRMVLISELKHKDGTHLFVYIEKAIKPNSREIRAKVGLIIKEGGVDNATFMDEM
ncbi:hypothetical protein Tco_0157143 [Tanacetum coccineum]